MKRYYSVEDAPLGFHNFFLYVSIPLGTILTIFNMVATYAGGFEFSWIVVFDLLFNSTYVIFNIMIYIGLRKWERRSWYYLMISLTFRPIYSIIEIILYGLYFPSEVGVATGKMLGYTVFAILVGLYYFKRKPLFFNAESKITEIKNDKLSDTTLGSKYDDLTISDERIMHPQKYCRHCGQPFLSQDTLYCIKCGTKVILNEDMSSLWREI